jgi:hypothetical protein
MYILAQQYSVDDLQYAYEEIKQGALESGSQGVGDINIGGTILLLLFLVIVVAGIFYATKNN